MTDNPGASAGHPDREPTNATAAGATPSLAHAPPVGSPNHENASHLEAAHEDATTSRPGKPQRASATRLPACVRRAVRHPQPRGWRGAAKLKTDRTGTKRDNLTRAERRAPLSSEAVAQTSGEGCGGNGTAESGGFGGRRPAPEPESRLLNDAVPSPTLCATATSRSNTLPTRSAEAGTHGDAGGYRPRALGSGAIAS